MKMAGWMESEEAGLVWQCMAVTKGFQIDDVWWTNI